MSDQVPLLVYHTECGVPYVLHRYDFITRKCWWTTKVTDTLVDYYIDNPNQWPGSEHFDYRYWGKVLQNIGYELVQQNRFRSDQLMLVTD